MAEIIRFAQRSDPMPEQSLDARVTAIEVEVRNLKGDVEKLDGRMTELVTTQASHHSENSRRLAEIQTTLDVQSGERTAHRRFGELAARTIIAGGTAIVSAALTWLAGHH